MQFLSLNFGRVHPLVLPPLILQCLCFPMPKAKRQRTTRRGGKTTSSATSSAPRRGRPAGTGSRRSPRGRPVNHGGQEPQAAAQTPTDSLFSLEQVLERIRLEVRAELQALQASNVLASAPAESRSPHPPTAPSDSQTQQQALAPSASAAPWLPVK